MGKGAGQMQLVVKEYEGVPFKVGQLKLSTSEFSYIPVLQGPSSLAFDAEGALYFTDSGPLGESTLQSPNGSCYVISGPPGGQILRPLARDCLAHPCGVAVASSGAVYVSFPFSPFLPRHSYVNV